MPVDEPSWWYGAGPDDWRIQALKPVSELYGWIATWRLDKTEPYRSRLPVICVGNLTAGGTGKTPLALLIAEVLCKHGLQPVFLTRGYKGKLAGPVAVKPANHAAADVGDEPLLLAKAAPTVVSRNRATGAQFIENLTQPADVIVMDDGLQNPALKKDLTIAVVDGTRGFGNGETIPAGPLRAPLKIQLPLVDAFVVNQPSTAEKTSVYQRLRSKFPGPVLTADAVVHGDAPPLDGKPVIAYAGIGNPQRFFDLLTMSGANIVKHLAFPDHHSFSEEDAAKIHSYAKQYNAVPITTEKDWVRISNDTLHCRRLRQQSQTLPVKLDFPPHDEERLKSLVLATSDSKRNVS